MKEIISRTVKLLLSLEEQPLPSTSKSGIQITTVIRNEEVRGPIDTMFWHVDITHVTDPLSVSDVSIAVDFFHVFPSNSYLANLPLPPTTFTEIDGVLTWLTEDSEAFNGGWTVAYLELKLTWSVGCPSGDYDVLVYVTNSA